MFRESLLESAGGVRTNQRWTTLFSLSLEAMVIAVLVLLPLLENQALPRLLWNVTTPVAPPPLGVPHPGHGGGGRQSHDANTLVLTQPPSIPLHTDTTSDGRGSSAKGSGPDLPVGFPWGVRDSVGPLLPAPVAPSTPPPAPVARRVSIVTEGNIVYKVLPT